MATAAHAASAQVVLDGSVGPAGPRQGPNFSIPHTVGRLSGGNLLHSFSQFNVNAGESATFTGPTDAQVSNVIARVTGGGPSNVNGLLRSAIQGANFYLVNPRGVVFGPGAQLDVGGSFFATSADYVRLADGTRIDARTAAPVVLTSASPAAFGFLAARAAPRGTVSYTGDPQQPAGLGVPDGRSLSLVGGPVRIVSGRIQALGGRVNLVSVAAGARGEVAFDAGDPAPPVDASSLRRFGPVDLLDGSSLRGPVGGSVWVRGGDLTIDRSSVNADTDVTPGGGVELRAARRLTITNGRVSTETFGPADGGAITVAARDFSVTGLFTDGSAPVSANTSSTGRGGDVRIEAATMSVLADAALTAFTSGPGAGGNIDVAASRRVTINGAGTTFLAGLAAETLVPPGAASGASGSGGSIAVRAPRVQVLSRGEVTSTTRGAGDAGTISVRARDLLIDGNNALTLTGLQARVGRSGGEAGASGRGGQISVSAERVRIVRGGVISATTFGAGDGGSIDVAAGEVLLRGSPRSPFTGLFARSEAAGDAGTVRVAASQRVRASRGAQLSTAAAASARAGDVVVDGGRLLDADGGRFTAESGADGGNIALTAAAVSLRRTDVRTAAGADGGNITVSRPVPPRGAGPARAPGPPLAHREPRQLAHAAGVPARETAAAFLDTTINANGGVNGGDVTVRPDALFRTRTVITATGALGVSGAVNVSPAETELAGSLAALPASLASEAARLLPACGVTFGGGVSSFVVTGRGGSPPEPGGWRADEWVFGLPSRDESLSAPGATR